MKIINKGAIGVGMGLLMLANADNVHASSEYIVEPGDTLGKIATKHNTTVDELVEINNIKDKNRINVGQKLQLNNEVSGDKIEETISYFEEEGFMPIDRYNYQITSRFGERENPFLSNEVSIHYGLDISSSEINGVSIHSLLPGRVVTSTFDNKGYGNYVKIEHVNGLETLYAHMIKMPEVNVGDYVEAGQVIGNVGNTGNSTGPHLHLEVLIDGEQQDPEQFLEGVDEWPKVDLEPITSIPGEYEELSEDFSANKGGREIYTVEKGDSLSKIAKMKNTSVSKLKEVNDMGNSDIIYVGQSLIISKPADDEPEYTKYTIKKGDSLWKIANENNMTVKELKEINKLHSDLIFVGDYLVVISWLEISNWAYVKAKEMKL